MKQIAALFGAASTFIVGLAVVVSGPSGGSPPSATALFEIPGPLLARYVDASGSCTGLPWQVLAAIGYLESRHAQGHADPVTGDVVPPMFGPALDGTNGTERIPDEASLDGWAHAEGPMQFLPATWAKWGRTAPERAGAAAPSAQNAWDAIYSAAAYLCAGRDEIDDLDRAVLSYNHSESYLRAVRAKAVEYGLADVREPVIDGRTCPVAGIVSFSDDWGAPRSGGRTHEGIDLVAPYGSPLVAIEAGVVDLVTDVDEGLGGISLWLRGDSGARYYYAHNAVNVARVGDRLSAGQVVAVLGNTGNARESVAHVHFEIHPDGGDAVNPYATVAPLCGA